MTKQGERRFERLLDRVAAGGVLAPQLEQAVMLHGEQAWPEEYAITVGNKEKLWDGYFHPSSHADADPLQLYYIFHPEIDTPFTRPAPDDVMAFQWGRVGHAMVQSMLVMFGYADPADIERPFVSKERWCAGALDVAKLTLPELPKWAIGKDLPVDIKTVTRLPFKPSLAHRKQIQVYMDLGCDEPQDIGLLLYFELPHPHRFREFVIHRDEEELSSIYAMWRSVLEAIEFNDPTGFLDCCQPGSKRHFECPARNVCRIGPPPMLMRR